MAAQLPPDEKRMVPAYMVSFGDMITLLLTFFILLVAMSATQDAGLVAAGYGPVVKHVNAHGQPGRLREMRLSYKADSWWIPSQEGDPDQIERVVDKLERELQTRFRPGEASISYGADHLVLSLPARVAADGDGKGRPVLSPELVELIGTVGEALRGRPERRVRIHGTVPPGAALGIELYESANLGRLVVERLLKEGVRPHQLSLWGWGASRGGEARRAERGITLEVLDPPTPAAGHQGK
jgi:hypothetical protein